MMLILMLIATAAVVCVLWAGGSEDHSSRQPVCLRHSDEDEEF